MIRKRICCFSIAFVVLVAVLGCGDDSGLPRRYPVSGKVTYNGQPLGHGNISFTSVDPNGRAASGTITDGRYTLTTHDPDDGALPGSYKVSIMAKKTDPSKVQVKLNRPGGGALSEAQKNAIALQFQHLTLGKAAAAAQDLVPTRYSSPETSGLKAEVKEQSNSADFELKD